MKHNPLVALALAAVAAVVAAPVGPLSCRPAAAQPPGAEARPPDTLLVPLPPEAGSPARAVAGQSTASDNSLLSESLPPGIAEPGEIFTGPIVNQGLDAPAIPPAQPAATDAVLPINLATALRLSNARPLVIAFAQAGVEEAVARLEHASVLWLPNVNVGTDYYRHDGTDQATDGSIIVDSKNALALGAGVTLSLGLTDAMFLPLVARQELCARQFDRQTAGNDALLSVAQAYFDVQQARGQMAASLDVQAKAEELLARVTSLARGLTPEIEVDRVRAVLADVKQEAATTRYAWRAASARLNRVLRLNPGALVVPLEEPQLQVTLISPAHTVDDLIPVGLMNRPELASHRAVVRLTLERLRQERLRPLIPSLALQGRNGPGGLFTGGVFGGGTNDTLGHMDGRFDMDVGVVWTFQNLGLGNQALVRERAAQQQAAVIELCSAQDRVAEEVVQAQAQVEAQQTQMPDATTAVQEAVITFQGNLKGIAQTRSAGDLLILVNRPQEAVAALQQLDRAYRNYYGVVNGYNRAQFQLYHALGFPARIVAVDCPPGDVQSVDPRNVSRP